MGNCCSKSEDYGATTPLIGPQPINEYGTRERIKTPRPSPIGAAEAVSQSQNKRDGEETRDNEGNNVSDGEVHQSEPPAGSSVPKGEDEQEASAQSQDKQGSNNEGVSDGEVHQSEPPAGSSVPKGVVVEDEQEASAQSQDKQGGGAQVKKRQKNRDEDRVEQEKDERVCARQLVEGFMREHNDEYHLTSEMEDLGCRLQKYWYKGKSCQLPYEIIITVAPISKSCPLNLKKDLDRINRKILPVLCDTKQKNLHNLNKIFRVSDIHVIVIQELHPHGSLRDLLYKAEFQCDWSKKYSNKTTFLPQGTIALYGRQILEAMVFLYEQGFSSLGHVHSGNIFITDDGSCVLGGIDNSLLGYRSYVHKQLGEDQNVDVIMFGLLIFEMASHRDLLHLTPDEEDLSTVRDTEVKAALESIFQLDEERMMSSIQEILNLQLFQSAKYSHPHVKRAATLSDDPKIKKILEASTPKVQEEMKQPKTKFDGILKKLGFSSGSSLLHIGWRKDKHWKVVSKPGDSTLNTLMSFAKVSETCPIALADNAIRTINRFLKSCSEHPVLHPIQSIEFCSGFVITIQPLRKASLKDIIYKTDPLSDWSAKQNSEGNHLLKERVFLYVKQILKALLILYEMGFPPLGQVHSGNIFMDGDICQLGGYENTLLGYRTQFHEMFNDHLDFIDVIMFGHVVYEMGSGRELRTLIPFDEDYRKVSNKDVRSFLKWVFQIENHTFVHSIEEIYQHHFIREAITSEDSAMPAITISEDMKYLLSEVTKGKARQNTKIGLFRKKLGRFAKGAKKE